MPKVKFDIKELIESPLPKLPYIDEFLLYLFNNNYSKHTIYNYFRDLTYFAIFLQEYKIDFSQLTKQHITYFKGWLKERLHIKALEEYKARIKKSPMVTKASGLKNIGFSGILQDQAGASVSSGTKNLTVSEDFLKDLEKLGRSFKEDNVNSVPTEYNLGNTQKANAVDSKNSDTDSGNSSTNYKGGYVKNNDPQELDSASINRILVALRNYLRFLIENDYPTPILPEHIKLVRASKKLPKVPSLEDVLKLVEAPTHLETDEFIAKRNRAMLETLLATGMRISELVSLNRNQINWEGKLFIMGKGRKERMVYLTPRALKHLQEYLKLRDDPFPALFIPKIKKALKRKDPRISTNYIQMKIAEYRRRLGLVVPISAHSIRHAFATYMVERGANPAVLQVLLGHESLQTTTKYVHTSDILAEREHSKFHPVKE